MIAFINWILSLDMKNLRLHLLLAQVKYENSLAKFKNKK